VPVFERLVEDSLRDGRGEKALAYLARGRSRTLLDQLHLAGIDPRAHLTGTEGESLRRREEELRQTISAIRAEAQLLSLAADEKQAQALLTKLEQAQRDYAQVHSEVLNASPVYRALAARTLPDELLGTVRSRVLGSNRVLLHYYIGRQRSFVLLLRGQQSSPATPAVEAFPLLVPARLARNLGDLLAENPQDSPFVSRGLVVEERPPDEMPSAPAAPESGPSLPLTEQLARSLVNHYRKELTRRDFVPTRGLVVTPRDPARPLPPQQLNLPGNIFLPPALRQRLRECAAEVVVVVPDGALHKLPLESLLIESEPVPRFVLDELPPLVYAPSLAVLALQVQRPRLTSSGPPSLLTVANPAYAEGPTVRTRSTTQAVLGLPGQLRRLEFSAEETRRIRRFFADAQVLGLDGAQATEREFKAKVQGRRFVHVAAHGFSFEQFGNLFGALALSPPTGKPDADDDGFLTLHEIYSLPLGQCELAVLSACQTNTGAQRPLEAGVTLASGFLAAGARRVVASHWDVGDRSTAELIEAFFEEAVGRQDRVGFPLALQRARQRLREIPRYSAPRYWAPFVLLGPPD
jgi:CHAT domain-containing protein